MTFLKISCSSVSIWQQTGLLHKILFWKVISFYSFMQSLSMSSILFRHTDWVLWWWDNRIRILKINRTNKERNECLRYLKRRQLRCNCHCPGARACSARSASLSRRCPGASGLMAGGMCSFLPLMSIPGVSFAIFCAYDYDYDYEQVSLYHTPRHARLIFS